MNYTVNHVSCAHLWFDRVKLSVIRTVRVCACVCVCHCRMGCDHLRYVLQVGLTIIWRLPLKIQLNWNTCSVEYYWIQGAIALIHWKIENSENFCNLEEIPVSCGTSSIFMCFSSIFLIKSPLYELNSHCSEQFPLTFIHSQHLHFENKIFLDFAVSFLLPWKHHTIVIIE